MTRPSKFAILSIGFHPFAGVLACGGGSSRTGRFARISSTLRKKAP
jgi:hypothetical protein